jgi:hypothetical protein
MSSKGWFNLEAVGGTMPETQFFEGDSAFHALGLTRTQRLYGFAAWYVVVVIPPFVIFWGVLLLVAFGLSVNLLFDETTSLPAFLLD